MCIRDRFHLPGLQDVTVHVDFTAIIAAADAAGLELLGYTCLLYTSDAADERSSVDLGGRRIIKKKKQPVHTTGYTMQR